jgi:hypothetical protein
MTHTPGPWKLVRLGRNLYVESDGPQAVDGRGPFVCDMQIDECAKPFRDSVEADANLIAAAPELLEALTGIIEIGKRDMTNQKYDGYFKSAQAAIAKAKGQNVQV